MFYFSLFKYFFLIFNIYLYILFCICIYKNSSRVVVDFSHLQLIIRRFCIFMYNIYGNRLWMFFRITNYKRITLIICGACLSNFFFYQLHYLFQLKYIKVNYLYIITLWKFYLLGYLRNPMLCHRRHATV